MADVESSLAVTKCPCCGADMDAAIPVVDVGIITLAKQVRDIAGFDTRPPPSPKEGPGLKRGDAVTIVCRGKVRRFVVTRVAEPRR